VLMVAKLVAAVDVISGFKKAILTMLSYISFKNEVFLYRD